MATGLIDIMKRASMDVMENSKPCDLRFGTVTSTSPLKVQITPQFILPASTLIVPTHLTDYSVDVTMDWESEPHTHTHGASIQDTYSGGGSITIDTATHTHSVIGKKSIIIHAALKVGDKVALIRQSGGQSYYILDRI